jgi:tetratricopeptide (TPR) repeat protein
MKTGKKRKQQKKLIPHLSKLLPLIIVICIELLLWLFIGFPPSQPASELFNYEYLEIHEPFFKIKEHRGKKYWVPQRNKNCAKPFPVNKNPGKIRIFLTGGSFAVDWNTPLLEKQLNGILQQNNLKKTCEIINCGMAVYDSYRVSLVVREIVKYQPDLIIVLCGNGENVYTKNINTTLYAIRRLLDKSWLFSTTQNTIAGISRRNQNVLEPDKENIDLSEKFEAYKKNMATIFQLAKSKNIPLITGTLPINLNGIPPVGKRPIDKIFLKGCLLLENGNFNEAIDAFRHYIRKYPDNAFGYFYLGKTYEKKKEFEKAKLNYYTAAKYDKAVRINPEMNEYLRSVYQEKKNGFIDLDTTFNRLAQNNISGINQFRDDCHIWPEYYGLASITLYEEIFNQTTIFETVFKQKWTEKIPFETPGLPELDPFFYPIPQIRGVWAIVSNKEGGLCEYAIALFQTSRSMKASALDSINFYKERIKHVLKNDFYLKHALKDADLFENQWPLVLYHVGELFRREKIYEKAIQFFNASIALNKNNWLPYLGKTLVFHSLGRTEEVKKNIDLADRLTSSQEIQRYKELLL